MQDVHRGEVVAPWVVCGHREGHSKAWPAVRMRGCGLIATFLLRFLKLLLHGERRQGRLMRGLVMETQYLGGQLMQIKDASDSAMINDDGVTGLDDACEFPGGEGMREGKPDDLLLHMGRHAFFDGGLPLGSAHV